MHNTRKNIVELLVLLLVWMLLVYGLNVAMAVKRTPELQWKMFINYGFFGLLNFIPFYIYLRWIIPPFLQKNNWVKLLSLLLPLMLGTIVLKYLIADHFFREEVLFSGYRYEHREKVFLYVSATNYFISSLWGGAVIVLAAFSYRFFILWLEEDKRRAILQQQQLQAESGFLKMQLNSHFLINSLNSIYSLALMDSPEVVRAHKTLTDLLAYMVEQPSDIGYRAPIAEEIRYLQDFVTLQRIRTGCQEGIVFRLPEQVPDKEIAPLLLVPFVENAFKHGVTNRPEKPVRITLECTQQQMVFTVHNYISGYQRDKTGGIGLDNVRKRLQLLYPGRHELEILDMKEEYCSNLVINW
ncbi:sensor histidine kinase [Chitinophaga sp. 22321]|uniref:Histidine kinase n=1 Tax=Chitinophaga hostae TaxID=2831022 RepID=A0ABS5J7C0_9BACT|nr:histidine kinase [Chitinophaga hostae]MBS0031119.1 histidine kinase [Chitinophaga hostae]